MQEAFGSRRQVTREWRRYRLAPADHLGANGAVGRGDRQLDDADKLRTARGFELPHEQRDGYGGRIPCVHEPNVRACGQREPQGRVEIAVRRRRPAPDGILGQLAAGPLVEQPVADVPAGLRLEEPERHGRCR